MRYKPPSHTSQPIKNTVRHTPGLHSHQTIMEETHNRYFTTILAPGDYNIWVGTGAQDKHYVTRVDTIQMTKQTSDCSRSSSPCSTGQHKLPADGTDCSEWWCYHTGCATGDTVITQYHSRTRVITTKDQLQPHCYLWSSCTHTVCATMKWTWLNLAPFEGAGLDKCIYLPN